MAMRLKGYPTHPKAVPLYYASLGSFRDLVEPRNGESRQIVMIITIRSC